MSREIVPSTSIDRFLREAGRSPAPAPTGTVRLIFALDATASREPTWDLACALHAELFDVAAQHGNLAIQLCHYGGHQEFRASAFAMTAPALLEEMLRVRCKAGRTQIVRLIEHAITEATAHPVRALVFIGDAFEEGLAALEGAAARLAMLGVPAFVFQEGNDPVANEAFSALAQLTRGAHVPFAPGSAESLRELLGAVARYAAGGRAALEHHAPRGSAARLLRARLLEQLPP